MSVDVASFPSIQESQERAGGDLRSRAGRNVARIATAAAFVGLELLGSAAAVQYGPAEEIEVAGAPVAVSSELGKDYSSITLTNDNSNSLLIQKHKDAFGLSIGASASINRRDITYSFLEQVAGDPAPLADRLQETAKHHFLTRAAEGAGGVLLLELTALGLLVYGSRIDSERRRNALRNTVVGSATIAGMAVSVAGVNALTASDHETVVGSTILAGTPLAGIEVNVKPEVVSYLLQQTSRSNTKFYQSVVERTLPLITDSPYFTDERWSNFVLVDDLQGNKGMAQEAGTVANLIGANVITTGDMTDLATESETYIIDTLKHYADTDILMAAGLHDTRFITDYAIERGFIVPAGEQLTVDGVDVIGFNDPRVSNISELEAGNSLRNPDESIEQFADRMTDSVCAVRPDIVFTHDYKLVSDLAESGCARIVVAGRTFDGTSEKLYAAAAEDEVGSTELILGSGGGHSTTNVITKNLESPAQVAILQFDALSGESRYLTLTVQSDGTPVLSPPRYLTEPSVASEAQAEPESDEGLVGEAKAVEESPQKITAQNQPK
jgi:hypothetical protein